MANPVGEASRWQLRRARSLANCGGEAALARAVLGIESQEQRRDSSHEEARAHARRNTADHEPDARRHGDAQEKLARVEHRVASADVNVYLALATILAGGIAGLDGAIEPPP